MSNTISCPAVSSFRRGYEFGGRPTSLERQGDVGWGVARKDPEHAWRCEVRKDLTGEVRPVYTLVSTKGDK